MLKLIPFRAVCDCKLWWNASQSVNYLLFVFHIVVNWISIKDSMRCGWNGATFCFSVKKDVKFRINILLWYYIRILHTQATCFLMRAAGPDEGKLISFPLSAEPGPEVSPHGGSWECHSHSHAGDPSSSSVSLLPWYSPTLSPNVTESKTNSTERIYQGGTRGLMAACKPALWTELEFLINNI